MLVPALVILVLVVIARLVTVVRTDRPVSPPH